jgi:hypothetical protein
MSEDSSNLSKQDSIARLIDKWHFRAQKIQRSHYDAAKFYHKCYLWFAIPIVIVSAVSGGSLLTRLIPDWVGGVIALVVSAMFALQVFLAHAERSTRHKIAAVQYGAIRRAIEQLKADLANKKANPNIEVTSIRKQFDALAMESPDVPLAILKRHGHNPDTLPAAAKDIAP